MPVDRLPQNSSGEPDLKTTLKNFRITPRKCCCDGMKIHCACFIKPSYLAWALVTSLKFKGKHFLHMIENLRFLQFVILKRDKGR